MSSTTATFEVHVDPEHIEATLHEDARQGLRSSPKILPPKWFYDERGSALFDEITRLEEYYPTRREREILTRHADEIAAVSDADTLVELGSGTSEKTRLLLDALAARETLRRFIPFDVSAQTLRDAALAVDAEYPGVLVHGVAGDFEHHLDRIPTGGRRLVAFLGGTIGNLDPRARARFLDEIAADLGPGDAFLLGTDLVKDPRRLVAAYDDSRGVTAAFNKNVLAVLNRELDADFDLDGFEHVARWNEHESQIEMWLRASRAMTVRLPVIGEVVEFSRGEEMRTEVSAKFTPEGIESELARSGLTVVRRWTDAAADFAVSLSVASRPD